MNALPHRDVAIFSEALELPEAERAAYLDRACGSDRELREKVESLLTTHGVLGNFLEDSPQKILETDKAATLAGEKPGDRIGHYKLLQQIGEGGCGVVFLAEQEESVRRRVALKIIKPGMDTNNVIARFESERQALALMDHPGIAKIFDAGSTESGRPYFVMEFIRGPKITEYCDQHSLATEERLKLYIQVCQAIQHAHQKGIIHRDIKPSNILVTVSLEGVALPVVIDFGIAKATTNQRLTDKTIFTAFEMLIGTPAYMSPEQAELTSMDVDTRTDIYSLGVLLYELLTGSTPFDSRELLNCGLDEIRRVIREEEPVRPSTRLGKLTRANLKTLAQRHKSEPPHLIRVVRGDLDWIAMKALEKDRRRRYATAHGLALDVQHYLASEPISARPPSAIYKLQKMAVRNKALFIGIGVVTLLLVVSLAVVSAALAKERQARNVADAALRQAESDKANAQSASAKSQQVTKFLEDMLRAAGPSAARGRDTTMLREILDQTAERVGREMAHQPAVEAELRSLIGRTYFETGNYDRAEAMHRAALALNRKLFGPTSPQSAASLNSLGLALDKEKKFAEAEDASRGGLAIRRQLFGEENADVAASLNNLATVFRHQKRLPEAEPLARTALGIQRKLFKEDSSEVADTLHNLSVILGDQGQFTESETTAREMLAMRQRLVGPEHPLLASALADLAWAVSGLGELDKAEALYRQALAMRLNLLGGQHPDTLVTLRSLGLTLAAEHKWGEAERAQRDALAGWRQRTGNNDPNTLQALCDLGLTLERAGKSAEAVTVWREAFSLRRKLGTKEDPPTLYSLRDLGLTLESEGNWTDAETVWRESLGAWRALAGEEDAQSMYTLRKLAQALEAGKKWPEAEARQREALTLAHKLGGNHGPEALADMERLVRVLMAEKKLGEAERLLDEVLVPDFVPQPASANLLVERADLMGRRARWEGAATDAALALENQPTDHFRYHVLAGLLAITHNREAYEKLCQRLLPKFIDTTNPYIAERMALDCLLLPRSGVDLRLVDKLAGTAISVGAGNESLPYFQACKAMSNYRLAQYSNAVAWAEMAAASSLPYAQAKAYAVLALAHWQLGHKEMARAMLDRGDALAPPVSSVNDATDLGESWVAWLFARVQLDEAAALIRPQSNQ